MEFIGENQESQMDTENQSPSPSHVTNQVQSQGDFNKILNAGHKCNIVQADHVHVHKHEHHHHHHHHHHDVYMGSWSFSSITGSNVERPLPRVARLNTQKQRTCRKLLGRLDQLSARGEAKECKKTIYRLFRLRIKDPDCCAALWTAAAAYCINGGMMASARKALCHVTRLLGRTENRAEHELRRDYYKSLIYLREEKCDQLFEGVGLTTVALQTAEQVEVGCLRAWLSINLAWFYIKMANLQQDHHKQAALIKLAKESFARAIQDSCHEEEEFPGHVQDKKTRIRQCAQIGDVYLRLRCWRSVDGNNTDLEITGEIPPEDITEAEHTLISLEDREPLCGICEVLYHLAKAHLSYRFKKYPEALKEVEEARDLAIHGDFKNYVDIAESTVKLFKQAVI